ncbi:DUF3823 domain-containing protein [Chitinophagaceae bacterium LB-8]|uniref:DUF3823 domain-containing protein n=1 Tax=Paraflavisolibacter caeni TaxID=2982496 RepID=A0A9X3B8D0_9BACT|nr:DUF3823 domain-containing protein [Paraflavisolibacter caeni]MCU7549591.1 DUF3823 domain-containing protein [Paraflavisolibacter caeni]
MMKFRSYYIILCAFICLLASCSKDTYDPPGATFNGRIVYNGEAINVAYDQVRFQLWQSGFGKLTPIDVTIKQDGSFSSMLFNGTYKISFPGGQGPYMTKQNGTAKDTVALEINGNKSMDIEVLPYYMIRNPQFSISSGKVTGSFKLDKIITDANAKNIDKVVLYLNTTSFVSDAGSANVAKKELSGASITDMNNIILDVNVPTLTRTQDYIFARVGVKISGVEDMLYSPVKELKL